jgi:hypothetical protein
MVRNLEPGTRNPEISLCCYVVMSLWFCPEPCALRPEPFAVVPLRPCAAAPLHHPLTQSPPLPITSSGIRLNRYVVMSLWGYAVAPLRPCAAAPLRTPVISLCRYVVMGLCRCALAPLRRCATPEPIPSNLEQTSARLFKER